MTTASQTSSPGNARSLLLPYALGLVVAMVIAHVIAFVTVTTSFNLHPILRVMFLGFEIDGAGDAARTLLESSWFGATLVMSALWGLGLLVHLLGSVLGRGWED